MAAEGGDEVIEVKDDDEADTLVDTYRALVSGGCERGWLAVVGWLL